MPTAIPSLDAFKTLAAPGVTVPVYRTLLADHLTPVTAYERLAARSPHSFLLESVVGGERIARYSFLGAAPRTVIQATNHNVTISNPISSAHAPTRRDAASTLARTFHSPDPLAELQKLIGAANAVRVPGLPAFVGGAVGYAGYDTVRYLEPEKLASPPADDRHLPDLIFGLYDDLVIFDHVQKTILVAANAHMTGQTPQAAYADALARIDSIVAALQEPIPFTLGSIDLATEVRPPYTANFPPGGYQKAVLAAKEFIKAGDIFQVVLSQRLQTTTTARPFDIYRALRIVNPSPYMFYLASPECILVGSSPEIMCRVQDGVVTNRPLAGTRKRGKDEAEDKALEAELLADPKERAEHIMLVDLGRNDVGRVAQLGSVAISDIMTVERYSHVMHIVSNVTGKLAEGKTAFDALRMALPVGTVSGAPKVRAMQIIDELEPTKRGPYGGAIGYIDYAGNMDTCIGLRTMVITRKPEARSQKPEWTVYVQAGAGLVADSVPENEYQETINKASALLKAVAIAESGLTS